MICLGLVALLTFGTAFVFDPKIGMARDWDLYAFTGLPLGLLLPDKLLTTSLGRGRSAVSYTSIAPGFPGHVAVLPRG